MEGCLQSTGKGTRRSRSLCQRGKLVPSVDLSKGPDLSSYFQEEREKLGQKDGVSLLVPAIFLLTNNLCHCFTTPLNLRGRGVRIPFAVHFRISEGIVARGHVSVVNYTTVEKNLCNMRLPFTDGFPPLHDTFCTLRGLPCEKGNATSESAAINERHRSFYI